MEFSAIDAQRHNWCEVGGGTAIASGLPWLIDGYQGHELGFPHRPQCSQSLITGGEIAAVPISVGASTGLAVGNYSVAMTWEAVDSLGRVSRSAPSTASVVISGPNKSIAVTYTTLGPSSHGGRAAPVLYLSNDGGITFIRSKQTAFNYDPLSSTNITFTVDQTLVFLVGSPTLYTSGGILENIGPPAMRFCCEWQARLWMANDRDVWFSREILDGEEPSFSDALSFKLAAPCTGLAPIDDRMVLFCERAIYWTSGDGPTDTGQGGTFAQPQRIPSDFGCIDARSIVRTEKGVCFRSRRGIELIDRSLSPRFISGGVDQILREQGYSEVISASWDQDAQICRFIIKNPTNTTYLVLCWHTLYELWTTASIPLVGDSNGRTNQPIDIVNAANRNWMAFGDAGFGAATPVCRIAWEFLPSDALVNAIHFDGPTLAPQWYQTEIESANIKLDGLLGFSRIWRCEALIRDTTGDTGAEIGFFIDYSQVLASPSRQWLTQNEIDGGATASPNHYRYTVHIDKQQCSAIRLRFRDLQRPRIDGNSETNLTFVGFGIEWAQEPGTGRSSEKGKK